MRPLALDTPGVYPRDEPPAPTLAHINEQPGLPIKFDAKRGSDQLRARIYHDPRLTGLKLSVALALSEFVNPSTYTAHPKQARLAGMVHASRPRVSEALRGLATDGVIEIDRRRTYCRYIFRGEWRGRFKVVARPAAPESRCYEKEHHDVTKRNITGEPYVLNRRTGGGRPAAAEPPSGALPTPARTRTEGVVGTPRPAAARRATVPVASASAGEPAAVHEDQERASNGKRTRPRPPSDLDVASNPELTRVRTFKRDADADAWNKRMAAAQDERERRDAAEQRTPTCSACGGGRLFYSGGCRDCGDGPSPIPSADWNRGH